MKKSVFLLAMLSIISASCSSDDSSPSKPDTDKPVVNEPVTKGTLAPNVGGHNQPNQVFIDLSEKQELSVKRDTWDLGFSTGSDFRVVINGTVKMAVKQLNTTNIDAVQAEDQTVSVGFSTPADLGYVDNPTGVLSGTALGEGTAIKQISTNDAENKVYLVNMGFEVGTTSPSPGSTALDGASRGWKKIRITRQGDNYVVQYADINATTHQTVTISKDANYNFVYLNLKNGQKVSVQPKKNQWDISFTGFTNYFLYSGTQVTYYFADFITTNILGGTKVYRVESTADAVQAAYTSFSKASIDDSKFATSMSDQRVIGDSWRNGGGPSSAPSIKDDRFYVIKDSDNNVYKLRFLALTNDAGVRGNPVFEYELLK